MKRREARKIAVQTLYQVDIAKTDWRQALNNIVGDRHTDPFLEQLVSGAVEHLAEIDRRIEQAVSHWSLDRLSRVDHAILRLAVYELHYMQETPPAVVINEAVELGKAFGTEKNGKFINGVLGKVVKQGAEE
ncbi:transcription antitermination factor NusB [Caldalkalibacillus thermarum TA2.A1]|uniref:Transcription antitermination protein NusB n=1 Tax=Caldalkalibacillus thermarum (strain TA2.A1) TaxID=986075 RepID=A0A8X8I6U9_CALTT|nr:transcription antitermination factor NusB [Caldalkalibacillus thermarum]QZT32653.1 transcription antitermination factor NusB [Caldalkalibacillus thermarum TA2.A1]GGK19066.1 N utilization substance protein B [Caldalkalibacillus thermarum]